MDNTSIKTWRERIGVGPDFPLHAPTDVERAMVAEIAELRAARCVEPRPDIVAVRFNDLMALARQIIAEQMDDCDEEFMAGRAHGVGSFHSEILELSKRTALAQAQGDAGNPASVQDQHQGAGDAGAAQTCRSSEAAQAGPNSICERKTDDIMRREGYRKTGYVLVTDDPAARICVSDQGAISWFTREQWTWLMHNRDHVEFQWPKPLGVRVQQVTQENGTDPAVVPQDSGTASAALPPTSGLRIRAELAEEVLATALWLYRRLPRGYGRPPTVERPILALAKLTGITVAGCLADRGLVEIE